MRKEDSDGDEVSKGGPGVTFHEHHMEDLASQIGGMISNGYQLMQAPTCIYEGIIKLDSVDSYLNTDVFH